MSAAQVTEAHKQLVATIVEQAFRFAEGNHKITPLSQLIADSEARATEQLRQQVANLEYSNNSHQETAETWRSAAIENIQLRAELEQARNGRHASQRLNYEQIVKLGEANKEIRAEVERLKDHAFDKDGTPWKTVCGWWSKKYDTAERQMGENAARAERAEEIADRYGKRAISLEAELAACKESLHLAEGTANLALVHRDAAEAELHALRLICGTTDANKFSTWVDRANARAEKAEAELAKAKAVLASIEEDGTEEHNAAVRLRRELATERARLDWLELRGPWDSWNGFGETGITLRENIRAAIDAAMKEGSA